MLARESPETAMRDLRDLLAIDLETLADDGIYLHAVQLASVYRLHVFDTLYHATALAANDAIFVTADSRYESRARDAGTIVRLGAFVAPA